MKHFSILLIVALTLAACGRLADQPQVLPTARPAAEATTDLLSDATVEGAPEATEMATTDATVEPDASATQEATDAVMLPVESVHVVDAGLTDVLALGEALFTQGAHGATPCAGCHNAHNDVRLLGPGLLTVAHRAEHRIAGMTAAEYLHESIVDPGAFVVSGYFNMMPKDFGAIYSDAEIDALVQYMLSLDMPESAELAGDAAQTG